MKRFISLLLLLILLLSLCACDSQGAGTVFEFEEFRHINELLAAGDYKGAIAAIEALSNQVIVPALPTPEEDTLLEQYAEIARALKAYEAGEALVVKDLQNQYTYWDQDQNQAALNFIYNWLSQREDLDVWLQNETFVQNYFADAGQYNWNRQSLLDSFQILPDMKLSRTFTNVDNLGNVTTETTTWEYDTQGRLVRCLNDGYNPLIFTPSYLSDSYELILNESGQVLQRKNLRFDRTTEALYEYVYGGTSLTALNCTDNEGSYTASVTCVGAGQVTHVIWQDGNPHTRDHTEYIYNYDASGNLVWAECRIYDSYTETDDFGVVHEGEYVQFHYTMAYTYTDGVLTSGTYRFAEWRRGPIRNEQTMEDEYVIFQDEEQQHKYSFSCDDQGRVMSVSVNCGDYVDTYGSDIGEVKPYEFDRQEIAVVYGDYYIYLPAAGQ